MHEISKSQVEYAKSVDLLDYLQRHEPDNLKKVGRSYQLKDHDSFSISNGKWNWFSQGVGCSKSTALNYLTKVRGYDFKEAVRLLAEDRGIAYEPPPRSPPERRPLLLPTRNSNTRRVSAYLQTRGIDKATIDECVKAGSLYESAFYHNCVFVGRSSTNRIKYAAMRGTNTDFKQDAFGSDKHFGFTIPPKGEAAESVSVFESPIDAMSYRTLINNGLQVADTFLLSLGGVSDIALRQFLSCHKGIEEIVVCTDNDVAGNEAFERISKTFDIPVKRDKPQFGKDWNDSLLAIRELWYEHNVQVKSMEVR
jgi:hypothetical protein